MRSFACLLCVVNVAAVHLHPRQNVSLLAEDEDVPGKVAGQEIGDILAEAARVNALQQQPSLQVSSGNTVQLMKLKSGDVTDSQKLLLDAGSLFNRASSAGQSSAEKAIEHDIAEAMQEAPQVGKPGLVNTEPVSLGCLPDLNRCPRDWVVKGTLCVAPSTYMGRCSRSAALFDMSTEQKLAFASYCGTSFSCQEDCVQNVNAVCPSLWTEISPGVCEAPRNYVGSCHHRVNSARMLPSDKLNFGMKCGARWPCEAPRQHSYVDICPQGWTLGYGQTCHASQAYLGPCKSFAQMQGMTVGEKQSFEVACNVNWPEVDAAVCERNFAGPCPFGWRQQDRHGTMNCIAPQGYSVCSRVQSFSHLTPSEKQSWALNCAQNFPCRDRDSCEKDFNVHCPADWYSVNGGDSCVAPPTYTGSCGLIQHGLRIMTVEEKVVFAGKCSVMWPCRGEAFLSSTAIPPPPHRVPRHPPPLLGVKNGPLS